MKYKLLISISLSFTIFSCASQLRKFDDEQVKKYNSIKVINNELNLSSKCKYIKAVTISSGESNAWVVSVPGTYENAMLLLQEKAFKEGADTAVIDSTTQPENNYFMKIVAPTAYTISARIYSCNN